MVARRCRARHPAGRRPKAPAHRVVAREHSEPHRPAHKPAWSTAACKAECRVQRVLSRARLSRAGRSRARAWVHRIET